MSSLAVHPTTEPRGFRLAGELDLSNAIKLETSIRTAMAEGADGLTLDLSELAFMDSSGIRIIVDASKSSSDRAPLVLLRPSGEVLRILQIAGLDKGAPGLRVVVEAEPRSVAVERPAG